MIIYRLYFEKYQNKHEIFNTETTDQIILDSERSSTFRGDNATSHMLLGDSVAITNRGVYIPEPLFSNSLGNIHLFGNSSLRFDISLDLLAILAVLGIGLWGAAFIKRRADRIQEATGDRPKTLLLRLGVVLVPLAVLLVLLGFYLGMPELKGFNFQGGTYMRNSLIALWLALSLYTAAFIAENVRAGILAISKGQTEAAAALGLRPRRIMSLVILPQALRVIIPPLISQYLNLTKNSSLAIAVGYMDITGTLGGITLNQTGRELETHPAADAGLSDHLPEHFGGDELVQQIREAEGALR